MDKNRKLIYVCSPLKGDVESNVIKARQYCKSVLEKGHIPYAPHVMFNKILDDNDPKQRKIGLKVGLEMVKRCDEIWVFGKQISEGMRGEIELAQSQQMPIKFQNKDLEKLLQNPQKNIENQYRR